MTTPEQEFDQLLQELREAENKLYGKYKMGNQYTGSLIKLNTVAKVEACNGNWVWGEIDGYRFEAKVFKDTSGFGIDGGRISKLCIKKDEEEVVTYDRGWGKRPSAEHRKVYNKFINALDEEG
jgi:hypothetical protein